MQDWIEIKKKPVQIGKCSRGFIIDKAMLRLVSSETYIVRVIPEKNLPKKMEVE